MIGSPKKMIGTRKRRFSCAQQHLGRFDAAGAAVRLLQVASTPGLRIGARQVPVCFAVAPAYVYGMKSTAPFSAANRRLRAAGLRPTRQRLALAQLLLENGDRHVTAEQLHGEAVTSGIPVSLATVYNTLHQFTDAGLLRETVVEPGRSYFDTNTADHHHFFCEASGKLHDIPAQQVSVSGLPLPPAGTEIRRVDVIVRTRPSRA
jgi:Fur family transcriptional regulator, iron response regulator